MRSKIEFNRTAMLISFSVGNYRSVFDKIELSFEASTAIKDNATNGFTDSSNCRLLNSVAFYGANSSGKTNILRSLSRMRSIVLHSVKLNDNEKLPFDPFLLSSANTRPTIFDISFTDENVKYRYGFAYDADRIVSEQLFMKKARLSEKCLFERNNDEIIIDERYFPEGLPIKNETLRLNANRLFVSLAAQLGGVISKRIVEWFRSNVTVISGTNESFSAIQTKHILSDNNNPLRRHVLNLLDGMDLGIGELTTKIQEFDDIRLPAGLPIEILESLKRDPDISVFSHHKIYDENHNEVGSIEFDVIERESAGTNRLINISGPISKALQSGSLLCIDELEAQMHPLISWRLVEFFNNPSSNPNGAQLLFTTHDTNLLSSRLLRRDQIRFVEKNNFSTTITSMMDIKLENGHKPRNDSNYEKNYLEGKYGAIPFINAESFNQGQ